MGGMGATRRSTSDLDLPQCRPYFMPSPPLRPVPPLVLTISPSQTKSVVGSIRRILFAPITEPTPPSSAMPSSPAFGRTPPDGPSTLTSSIETFSMPSRVVLNPPSVRPAEPFFPYPQTRDQIRSYSHARCRRTGSTWFTRCIRLPCCPPTTIRFPRPRASRFPISVCPKANIRWLSLFPSGPIVVERLAPESGISLRSDAPEESVSSPRSSLRAIDHQLRYQYCYCESGSYIHQLSTQNLVFRLSQ
jgi:hypothetical protein